MMMMSFLIKLSKIENMCDHFCLQCQFYHFHNTLVFSSFPLTCKRRIRTRLCLHSHFYVIIPRSCRCYLNIHEASKLQDNISNGMFTSDYTFLSQHSSRYQSIPCSSFSRSYSAISNSVKYVTNVCIQCFLLH